MGSGSPVLVLLVGGWYMQGVPFVVGWFLVVFGMVCTGSPNPEETIDSNRSRNIDSSESTHVGQDSASLNVRMNKVVSFLTFPCGTTPSFVRVNVGLST